MCSVFSVLCSDRKRQGTDICQLPSFAHSHSHFHSHSPPSPFCSVIFRSAKQPELNFPVKGIQFRSSSPGRECVASLHAHQPGEWDVGPSPGIGPDAGAYASLRDARSFVCYANPPASGCKAADLGCGRDAGGLQGVGQPGGVRFRYCDQ